MVTSVIPSMLEECRRLDEHPILPPDDVGVPVRATDEIAVAVLLNQGEMLPYVICIPQMPIPACIDLDQHRIKKARPRKVRLLSPR